MSVGNVVVSQDAPAKNNLWIQPKGTARFWNGSIWKTISGSSGGGTNLPDITTAGKYLITAGSSGDYYATWGDLNLNSYINGDVGYAAVFNDNNSITSAKLTNSKIRIGNGIIEWDSTNNGFKIYNATSTQETPTTAGIYADWVSALGPNSSGGGGSGDLDWSSLINWDEDLTHVININYLPISLNNGVITIGNSSITPLTSHQDISGKADKTITITGTNGLSGGGTLEQNRTIGIDSTYKSKIDEILSMFELDSNGDIKTKDYIEGGVTKYRGFYSQSFVSALGLNSSGGGGGGMDETALWQELTDNSQWAQGDDKIINISHLPNNINADTVDGYHANSFAFADGTNATGTWGISINGNAATATKATQDGSGNTISSTYLKLAGGNMTGNIGYAGSRSTNTMITFINNTVDTYGNGIAIGGGGQAIIGGGESASIAMAQAGTAGAEIMYVCNDEAVNLISNLQSGWSYRKTFTWYNGQIGLLGDVTTTDASGIFWHSMPSSSTTNASYGIYKTAGSWTSNNYQQLKLDWPTGIILDGGSQYGKSGVHVNNLLYVNDYIRLGQDGNVIDGYKLSNNTYANLHLNYYSNGNTTLSYGGGNVGIGTNSPSYKLDVNGSGNFNGNLNLKHILYIGNGTYGSRIHIENNTQNTYFEIWRDTVNKLYFGYCDASSHYQYITLLSNGNIGISNTAPGYKLTVEGNIAASNTIGISQTAGSGDGISLYGSASSNPAYGIMFAQTANYGTFGDLTGDWATYFTMDTTWGSKRGWAFRIKNTSTIVASLSTDGNFCAKGGVTALVTSSSDKRLKKNIKPFNATEIVNKLKPVQFEWNNKAKKYNDNFKDGKNYGLIAQDSDGIIDDLVFDLPDGKGYKGVRYEKLIPILLQAIKELKQEINDLKNK